jgi:hypothetical protein
LGYTDTANFVRQVCPVQKFWGLCIQVYQLVDIHLRRECQVGSNVNSQHENRGIGGLCCSVHHSLKVNSMNSVLIYVLELRSVIAQSSIHAKHLARFDSGKILILNRDVQHHFLYHEKHIGISLSISIFPNTRTCHNTALAMFPSSSGLLLVYTHSHPSTHELKHATTLRPAL